jgi:hypothetical protein
MIPPIKGADMKRNMTMLAGFGVCLAGVFLTGCATTKQIVPGATGPIPTNSARIVVSRDRAILSCAVPYAITDGGKKIGELGPGGQLVWDRKAGGMELTPSIPEYSTIIAANDEIQWGKALRLGVGGGMSYQFQVHGTSWTKTLPQLELVSGHPVACEPNGTNACPAKVAQPLPHP